MNRLKLLAAIAVLGLPLAACEETTPPPPVGSIVGQVSIEGTGIDGVSVNLSNGNTTTTAGGGSYRFDNVEGGAYTVTISGFPSDATFDATSAAATISSAGQSVTLNFTGAYIRTASVMGTVTVENMGLGGVTVALSGVSSASAVTDDNGQYAFTGLRMGNYSVEISGFDNDEVGFSATAAAVTVGVGESKIISFDGTYLRTAGIMGRVSVEGAGLEGVTVSLSGGPDGADETTETDAAGQYSFAKLRAGDYAVGISGYDADDFEFEVTSQNVTVALGETANVPFEGVLLRTAGVSGRVSVEGIGLADVMVTLSMADAEDATAMTDAGGLYAFSGLAAGDYTVAIALSEEEMAAYVFESTSADVTLEDDMTSIVNFEAEHAATASVTVKLFVDEATKNDMFDEGEGAFPSAEMLAMVAELGLPLALPISLAGPGVHDMQSGTAMPDGSVVFADLKAGQYQVIVSDISDETLAALPPALGAVLRDYSYGGPATGYPLALTVGQEAMQYAPIDITHTTVNFGVTLKAGETRGMPLPGAMVTLYADAMGETKVGEGMTMVDEETMHAVASIRIARAGTSGNMVHAGVAADSAYTVAAGMTAVAWDPQKTYTMGANDNDIVNLNVDATFSGATITTDAGGGDALAGWAVSVMMGDSAVAGAPEMLDDDGMGAFMTTVDSLPTTFSIAVAADQANTLDGGENYEATDLEYTHTGLALAGTMDAGSIEVNYTTQTLKVYVHHELDQVMGYTGNVLGGDARASGMLDVGIRYINDAGRSRAFPATAKIGSSNKDGVYTFTNVPADHNVIAVADEAADSLNIMLIDPDELAAYTDADGATGGMFGANGGFSHTVELCPLQASDPTGQDHGECGSFAFVSTHSVSGLVWKRGVKMSGDDFDVAGQDPTFVAGISVSLAPVAGKNLAGEDQSYTSAATDTRKDKTKGIDATHQFAFSDIAAGVYKLSVPEGWRARMGGKGAEAMVGNALNPLGADVALDVTPTTATFFGRVNGGDGFPLDSVTVTANGVSAVTDEHGRYIVEGISAETRTVNKVKHTGMVFVTASRAGFDDADLQILEFASNSVTRNDFAMAGTAESATVSGTVTAFGSDTPIAGVQIEVDDGAPLNANAKKTKASLKNDIYVTGEDGTYTIRVPAKAAGATSRISASKDGFTFTPASLELSTPKGSAVSGINFQGVANSTIRGRVQAPGGGPLSGVEVKATGTNGSDADTTGVTGTYSLSVPAGTYTLAFNKAGYAFTCPGTPASCTVTAGLGQSVSFGDAKSNVDKMIATLSALSLSAGTLVPAFASNVTAYTADVANGVDTITVTATTTDANATVAIMPADADTVTAGHQVALSIGVNPITATVTAADSATTQSYTVNVTRANVEPTVTLVLTPDTIAESDGETPPVAGISTVTATVSPTVDSAFTVTVSIDASAQVATLSDSVVLRFAAGAGASTGTVTITAVNDASYTGDRTVTVSGASSDPAMAAHPDDATLTITEDETGSAPEAVQNLAAEAGDQQVKLTWERPLQTGSDPITGYKWTASATGRLTLNGEVGASAREYTVIGLANGVEYSFTVLAVSDAGDGAPGTAVTATPMPAITLTLSGNTLTEDGTDTLTATVSLSNPSVVAVEVAVAEIVDGDARLTVTGGTITIPLGRTTPTPGGTPTTIVAVDNALDDGGAAAMVQATSDNANSSDSDPAMDDAQPHEITIEDDDEAPSMPRSLTLTPGAAQIIAEWISPVEIGTAASITEYQYRAYKTADGAPAADAADQGWDTATSPQTITTDVADANLENGTEYTVEIRAVSAAGNGDIASGVATPAAS